MEYDKCMLRFHRRAVPSESGGRHSQVRIAAGGSELGWRMEDESFQVSEDREGGASGMIHDTRGENAANSGRPDQMHNTSAVVDHGVEHSGCSTGAEPDGGRAEATRAAKYEGDGERPITTQVAESISKRERIVKKDATGTSPVTDQANDRNPAAPVTTFACTTPTTPLTAAWPGPRQDSGGATQEVVNEKGVRQEVLVDGASGTHTEPDGDGLREVCIGSCCLSAGCQVAAGSSSRCLCLCALPVQKYPAHAIYVDEVLHRLHESGVGKLSFFLGFSRLHRRNLSKYVQTNQFLRTCSLNRHGHANHVGYWPTLLRNGVPAH